MEKHFGLMLDMSRNGVMAPEAVKRFALTIKKMGYNMLQLYTEDTYEVTDEPYFGYLRGRYSQAEMKDMVSYCNSIGVEMIPCIQTLAHLSQIFYWNSYRPIKDIDDIMMVGDERTYQLIENMFRSLRECYTTKYIHIGMDEAHNLGLGQYLDRHGYGNRFDIIYQHLTRVVEIAKKYDFTPIMWSDMFFRLANHGEYNITDLSVITDEVVNACPDGVEQVYWDYYNTDQSAYDIMMKAHAKFKGETWFAGGLWTWTGFVPNNYYTMKSMLPAMRACRENDVDHVFMTAWGDSGCECSLWSLLPALYTIRRAYDGEEDMEKIKAEFEELTGENYDEMLLLDLPIRLITQGKFSAGAHYCSFYNDFFLGLFDADLRDGVKEEYAEISERLAAIAAKGTPMSYLYDYLSGFAKVQSLKYDLGRRTRDAYKARDFKAILGIMDEYTRVTSAIEEFVVKARKRWYFENKPHGFDVQELRFGGMLFRIRSQRERLGQLVAGEIDSIPELDETILPYDGMYPADDEHEVPYWYGWRSCVSVNRI